MIGRERSYLMLALTKVRKRPSLGKDPAEHRASSFPGTCLLVNFGVSQGYAANWQKQPSFLSSDIRHFFGLVNANCIQSRSLLGRPMADPESTPPIEMLRSQARGSGPI